MGHCPTSEYLQPEYLAKVITALLVSFSHAFSCTEAETHPVQPRVAVLPDIQRPAVSSYFFTEPDLASPAAQSIKRGVSDGAYSEPSYHRCFGRFRGLTFFFSLARVLSATVDLLNTEDELVSAESIRDLLHKMHTNDLSGLSLKDIMNTLRYALSGSKVGSRGSRLLFLSFEF